MDVDAATAHGVVVVNTPGRNASAVAEHAMGLIFSLARRIPTAHNYVASGQWRHPAGGYVDLRGIELAGRTLGIVGMGADRTQTRRDGPGTRNVGAWLRPLCD